MKLPAYPRTKPSSLSACGHPQAGVEWLGDVPEHWDVKRHPRPEPSSNRAGDLRPEGATLLQPRATPWVCEPTNSSALKGRDKSRTTTREMEIGDIMRPPGGYAALSGLGMFGARYPGRCPGLYYFCPVGARNGGRP